MEPVAVIGWRRNREIYINWDSCFICQGCGSSKKKPFKPTQVGLERFKDCITHRQKYHDLEYIDTLDRVQSIDFVKAKNHIVWHKSRSSQFTHSNHIQRLRKRYEKEVSELSKQPSTETSTSEQQPSYSRPSSRSSVTQVSWNLCLFCQEVKTGKKLWNVATCET